MKRSLVGFGCVLVGLVAGCSAESAAEKSGAAASANAPGTTVSTGAAVEVDAAADAGTAGPNPLVPASTFTMTKTCAETVCQQQAATAQAQCSQCWSDLESAMASSYDLDDSDACDSVCNASSCDASAASECAAWSFTATVTAAPDANVNAACLADVAQAASCSPDDPNADADAQANTAMCAAYAVALKPEMADTLNCEATADCSATAPDCPEPAATTFGTSVCAGVTTACGNDQTLLDCSADGLANLNQLGGELRDDAANALLSCLAYDCADVTSCVGAWAVAAGFAPTTH